MNIHLENTVNDKLNEVKENIYNNLNFLMSNSGYNNKSSFFEKLSSNTGIPKRTIMSWYYKEKAPRLNKKSITILTREMNVCFSDFVSVRLDESYIMDEPVETFVPADVAKNNVLKLLIRHDIKNANQFEVKYEGNYSQNYFYVLYRKGANQRNISWSFLLATSYYFEVPISDLFCREEKK